MFYRKNVDKAERIVRAVGGGLMIACGFIGPGLSGTALGWILVVSGVVTIATGLFGFCPACAMAGKKPVE